MVDELVLDAATKGYLAFVIKRHSKSLSALELRMEVSRMTKLCDQASRAQGLCDENYIDFLSLLAFVPETSAHASRARELRAECASVVLGDRNFFLD